MVSLSALTICSLLLLGHIWHPGISSLWSFCCKWRRSKSQGRYLPRIRVFERLVHTQTSGAMWQQHRPVVRAHPCLPDHCFGNTYTCRKSSQHDSRMTKLTITCWLHKLHQWSMTQHCLPNHKLLYLHLHPCWYSWYECIYPVARMVKQALRCQEL